jgi:hypothetical protein
MKRERNPMSDDDATLPRFDALPVRPDAPPHSAWGLWGDADEIGTLNLLTPQCVTSANRLVRKGAIFPLNWDLELPDPPLFGREALQHTIKRTHHFVNDDVYHTFNTQSSSQWDGLTHYGNMTYHGFYNGVTEAEVTGDLGTRNGIQVWARRGIAGRGVLLDYRRWALAQGSLTRPVSATRSPSMHCGKRRGSRASRCVRDILIIRSGWIAWYLGLNRDERTAVANPPHDAVGVAQGEYAAFWDSHVAVVGDAIAFEALPAHPEYGFMHETLLALLGMPIGEMFYLSRLPTTARPTVCTSSSSRPPAQQAGWCRLTVQRLGNEMRCGLIVRNPLIIGKACRHGG